MGWRRAETWLPRSSSPVVGRYLLFLRVVASLSWLVPLLLLAVAGWQIWQQELHIAQARARSALGVLAEETEKVFETQEMALAWIDDHIRNRGWDEIEDSVELHEFLTAFDKNSSYIDSIWLFDANGDARATTRVFPLGRHRVNVADRDYFRSAEQDGRRMQIGSPAAGRMTGTFAFHVALRRSTTSGAFDGVILLALSPKYFENSFLRVADRETLTVMLIRADGVILASSNGPPSGSVLPSDSPYLTRMHDDLATPDMFETPVDGRNSIAAVQRLRRYPIYVAYAVDLGSVRGELWEHLGAFSVIAIACSVILFGASFHALRIAISEQRALRGWQVEIEQRQRMEDQMRQAFKMEALGRMAGGIAHHFNNLLPAMSGLLEQTLSEVPRNSATAQRVARMIDAVAQGRQLVRQILVFSRRETPGHDHLSMAAVVGDAIALIRDSIPPNIAVETNWQTDGEVVGDRAQLHESILNLLSNAIQAIGDRPAGRIVLSVKNQALDDHQARLFGLAPGPYIRIACRDNGSGMPADVVERAFDPFFTTKSAGQGTGLGLAITHGIVASHNGCVYIESEPDVGTTVSMYLPKAPTASAAPDQAAAA